jgi:hypothetical protein
VLTLCVALGSIVTASQTSLVAGDRVLVSLNAAILGITVSSQTSVVILQEAGNLNALAVPAQRKVRSRHDLNKVHKVEVGIVSLLMSVVKRILVVVGPERTLGADLASNALGKLGTETKRVDSVCKVVRVAFGHVPVVLKIVNVHITTAETSAGSEMEVTNDLVHAQASFNTAALIALRIQLLAIVFTLTLLNSLATTKGPRGLSIGFTNFVASLTTASLLSVGGRLSTIAATAVCGIEVVGGIVMKLERLCIDNGAAFVRGLETDFVDTVHNAVLLLARDIHNVETQQLAGHIGECDVEVDFHALAC